AVNTQADLSGVARQKAEQLRDKVQNAIHGGQLAQERSAYFGKRHEFPEQAEGLAFYTGVNRPVTAEEANDPWDNPYQLRFGAPDPGNQVVPFEIVSAGPDGDLDTDDDVRVDGLVNLWSYVTDTARQ